MRRSFLLALAASLLSLSAPAEPRVSSTESDVTVYMASWCGACRSLERELRSRNVPFAAVDVDADPRAFERARQATGENVIPQTSVATRAGLKWIVGADADAVERAYRER